MWIVANKKSASISSAKSFMTYLSSENPEFPMVFDPSAEVPRLREGLHQRRPWHERPICHTCLWQPWSLRTGWTWTLPFHQLHHGPWWFHLAWLWRSMMKHGETWWNFARTLVCCWSWYSAWTFLKAVQSRKTRKPKQIWPFLPVICDSGGKNIVKPPRWFGQLQQEAQSREQRRERRR